MRISDWSSDVCSSDLRQKNFYKNEGRPLANIIGIAEMAQTVMAILLQRPNDARARPSSLIKDDTDYTKIFNEAYDVRIYTISAKMKKIADQALRNAEGIESRTEERRVGKGWVSTCRSRWSRNH